MHMLNVISKTIKASSRVVIMEETHMKEKYEAKYNDLVYKAQNPIYSSTKVKLA